MIGKQKFLTIVGTITLTILAICAMVYFANSGDNPTVSAQVDNWGGGEMLIFGNPGISGTPIAIEVSDNGHLLTEDPVSRVIDVVAIKTNGTFTVASAVINTNELVAVAGHGLTITDVIFFRDASIPTYQQVGIVAVNANTITVDSPLDRAWSGNFGFGTPHMNANGSSTSVIYKLAPVSGIDIDVVRIIIQIDDDSAMDTGKFGGLNALTNGLVVRIDRGSYYETVFNAKTNGEFAQRAYDVTYADKAPAGTYGLTIRRTFGGISKNGSIIRLSGASSESIEFIVQDDLTGLTGMQITIQGHLAQ